LKTRLKIAELVAQSMTFCIIQFLLILSWTTDPFFYLTFVSQVCSTGIMRS